jgi:hypothetical protein
VMSKHLTATTRTSTSSDVKPLNSNNNNKHLK